MPNSREDILNLEVRARAGDLDAKHSLGMAYRRGDGVAQDKAKGAGLIIEAADGGCKPALSSVGVCYYFGDGVPKNHRLAMKWYQAAASAQIAEGFFNVADLFDDSDEIPKNPVEALAWFTCCLGAMPNAADRMHAIVADLSDENMDRAARRAVQIMTASQAGKPLDMVGDFAVVSPIPGSNRPVGSSKASLLSYLLFFHQRSQTEFSDGILLREVLRGKSPIFIALDETAEDLVMGDLWADKDRLLRVAGVHRLDDGSVAVLVFDDLRHVEARVGKHFAQELGSEELQALVMRSGIQHIIVNHGLPTAYGISRRGDSSQSDAVNGPDNSEQRTPSALPVPRPASPGPVPRLEIDWENIDPVDPKGYYAYFGVEPDAPLSAITQAYKRILRECADNAFVINEANIAYTVLSNPHKRRFYDKNQVNLTRLEAERRKPKVKEDSTASIYPSEDDTPKNAAQPSREPSNRYYGRTMGLPVEPEDRRPRRTSSGGCLVVMLPLSVGILWLLS